MKNLNIAIGKFGKSILFDSSKWGAIGGDLDAPLFYENLFHKNPNINFWLLGVSDFSRIPAKLRNRINKHGNVFDMHEHVRDYIKNPSVVAKWTDLYKDMHTDTLKNYVTAGATYEYISSVIIDKIPKMDLGIFFSGPDASASIPFKVAKSKEPDKMATPLQVLIRYCAGMIEFINKTNMPYIVLATDPRYYPSRSNDLLVVPKKVISQFNCTVDHNHYTSYSDVRKVHNKVAMSYNGLETIFLLGRNNTQESTSLTGFFDDDSSTRSSFNIVLNEGRPSRYDSLEKYILSNIDDVAIYGKWTHPATKHDIRFKGPKHINELDEILRHTKYTFIIPIKRGWVTAKFWEMLYFGIIPFMHPEYDTQNNLDVPEFIRIKSPTDLREKIQKLESDPIFYEELKSQLMSKMTPDLFDGTYLNDVTLRAIDDIVKDNA